MAADDAKTAAEYLDAARHELLDCHRKIRHCVDQLSDKQLWHRSGEDFNSIANLLLHLSGNIGQRIGSLVGGQPDTRQRDAEFAERGPIAKDVLWARFDDVIQRSDRLLESLPPERLLETRRFRMLRGDVERTVLKIILQTVVHVGGHTQEIIALTRLQLRARYKFMLEPAPVKH